MSAVPFYRSIHIVGHTVSDTVNRLERFLERDSECAVAVEIRIRRFPVAVAVKTRRVFCKTPPCLSRRALGIILPYSRCVCVCVCVCEREREREREREGRERERD